jgi:tRNA dimethylallyltransferase
LALALAEQAVGVIINADSAQVYPDLPVLSAAPSLDDLGRAEHRLYGFLDASIPCSAADWAIRARREIDEIHASDRLPILTGGTGLYLRTLIEGIAPVPPIDPEIRRRVRQTSLEENRAELKRLEPEAADRLNPADTARIARALEVILSTGRSTVEWQKHREGGIGRQIVLHPMLLLPPREWLYRRCDERFSLMVEQGAIEEVTRLLNRGLDPSLPVMRAIGVREIAAYLGGALTLDQAIAAGQQATRRYAKRQYTWFAHQPPANWRRFGEPLEEESLTQALELLSTSD